VSFAKTSGATRFATPSRQLGVMRPEPEAVPPSELASALLSSQHQWIASRPPCRS